MAFGPIPKLTAAQYKLTLKDDAGALVAKSAVTLLKLTLFNADDDAQGIINSRNAQDHGPSGLNFAGAVTMGATDGIITFAMTASDNPFQAAVPGKLQRYERHGLVFDITAGGKRYLWRDEILVEDVEKVSA